MGDEEFENSEEFERAAREMERAREPSDPFSPLMNAAVQMHEMVMQFVQAGFTRKEAIHIMLESLKNANANDDDDDLEDD